MMVESFTDIDRARTRKLVSKDDPLPVTDTPSTLMVIDVLNNILVQLKLLNARTEEGFQTYINEEDI